jgi:hypothetical protein
MESRKRVAAWAALTIAGVLLPFAPVVVGLRTLSHRDTDRLYAPIRTLVVEALRHGRLPLWNPYEGTGKPLFAEGIHSVLHPISLAGAALAPASIDFLLLAYLVAAAVGAFLLARALEASPPAAAAAGLAFALSGYSVSMTGNLVFLAGCSSLPWLVAAARKAGAGSPWGPLATALATAAAFLSGDVQTALVGLALGALLAAQAGGLRGVARASAGMVCGVLLAGVQLASTRELLASTNRGLDLEPWEKLRWPLEPGRLLEWVVPGLFRGPLSELPMGAAGVSFDGIVFAESVYLGAPVLVAAVFGALGSRGRAGRLLGVATLVLLWLALGHHLGAPRLLDWVPIWNKFRYAEKLMGPLALCLCTLGALGIDALGAGRLSRAWTRALWVAALVAGAGLLTLLLAPAATAELAGRLVGDRGPFFRATLAAGLPHLVTCLIALLAIDRLEGERPRVRALALLVALAPAAAVSSGAYLGTHDPGHQAAVMRLEAGDAPTPRLVQAVERANPPGRRQDPIGAEARDVALLLIPAVNVAHRVDSMAPYGAFESRRITTFARSLGVGWARSLRRFGLTHVAIPVPYDVQQREVAVLATEGGQLVQRDEPLGFELWTVPHRPWAFFAGRAVPLERPPGAHQMDPPAHALQTLLYLIDRGGDGTVVVEVAGPPPTAPGTVLGVERGTEALRVEAESLGPALLVLQDAFWPGWHATIDGQPAEILAADLLVRAVRWPAGRHRLEMSYDPPELQVGLAVSALGGALVVLLAALAVLQGRRARRYSTARMAA